MRLLEELRNWIDRLFGIGPNAEDALLSPERQAQLILTVVIIIVLIIVRRIAMQLIDRNVTNVSARFRWRKTLQYIQYGIGFILIGGIWSQSFGSLATVIGLASAGLAIALSAPLTNLAAWAYIVIRQPFNVGDRIQIGDVKGDVIDRRIFQIVMLEIGEWVDAEQSTGRVMYVPNQMVFSRPLSNYSTGIGYIWNEVSMEITFESDWRKAKGILQDIANRIDAPVLDPARHGLDEAAKRYPIMYQSLEPIVYLKVVENGVKLSVRFLCEPRQRRTTEEEFWENVLSAFSEHEDIQFAYPTQRFYSPETSGRWSIFGGNKAPENE